MTREFMWTDASALTNDISTLWNPSMMYSFPRAVKVEQTSPNSLEADGQECSMTEHLRVTFANPWNFTAYPMDKGSFKADIWSGFGTDILEPVTVLMDPLTLPKEVFGYRPKSRMVASVKEYGESEGPNGVLGQSQMITLSVEVERI